MTSTSVSGYTTKSGKKVSGYTQSRSGSGAAPKKSTKQRTRRRIGGGVAASSGTLFLASGFNFGSSILNFGTALFTVAGMSVMAWGTNRYVKKRKARKKTNQLGLPRGHRPATRRAQTPAQIRAKNDAKIQRKKVKHDLRKDWIASLFGPARVTKSDWSAP